MSFIVVIPARYESGRFPGKPLTKIKGVPMIIRTFNQCLKAVGRKKIFVATDDSRIQKLCLENNMQVIMTSKKCLTGTDRIAEVSKKIKVSNYVNVQGDEPIFNPSDIKKLIDQTKRYKNLIINGYCKIEDKKLFYNGNIPKVVFSNNGKLLYMSRAGIPTTKKLRYKLAWRQVCAYSIPYNALKAFYEYGKKTPLEKLEDCELLRFLELGYEIKMIKMSTKSISVDLKEDVKKVEKFIK
tara:strand:+ start:756 stop:1475 length:720 start_codon:yes stop_codon:yes gene_type:complete